MHLNVFIKPPLEHLGR